MSAMISSCMFSSAPSVANTRLTRMTMSRGRRVRRSRLPTSRPSAPVASRSANVPPTKRIVRMTSAPEMMPRGTAMSAPPGLTGAAFVGAYVPGTTTERWVTGSVRRW